MTDQPAPKGVLTFLMTDVEGSTRLWEEAPSEMAAAMRRHDELSAEIVSEHDGRVIKERGEGDALFCVFPNPTQAVRASVALQLALAATDWSTPRPIRVRMALHMGEAEQRNEDFYGPVINRCARLRGICHGRQIIVSEAVSLTAQGQTWLDLGSHRLRDLSTPEHVFQVCVAGMPSAFPPLASLGNSPNNLPEHPTSFVGREKESAEVLRLLGDHRLVTLVGPGGTGKTRLAQHVVESKVKDFPDGVWLIELDRLATLDDVLTEVAQVLRAPDIPGHSSTDRVLSFLKDKSVLLLLDNCEHVREPISKLVAGWLRSADKVRVLATSREPLAISGEALYRVPSLGIPGQEGESPLTLMGYESVQLFLERGKAVRTDLELTAANCTAVSRICRQLDGIPFAIELAAARARALSVEQIAERIDDRFRILGKGDTNRASRQHTLKALIDWSYELLTGEEKRVLSRLSVFTGGWTLDAAEVVVGFDPIEESEVLDHLVSLVDKSLVSYEADSQRYRMLETMRQYAAEKLGESGEAEVAAKRLAEYFFSLAELARAGLQGRDPNVWMDRLDADLDNFRLGIRTWRELSPETSARMIVALYRYFDAQTIFGEPREALTELLPRLMDQEVRASVLHSLGIFCRRQGDFLAAQRYLTEAVTLQDQLGQKDVTAALGLATVELFLSHPDTAISLAKNVLPRCEQLCDYRSLTTANLILGNAQAMKHDNAAASQEFERALSIAKQHGYPDLQVYAQSNLGLNLSKQGEHKRASQELREVIALAHSMSIRALVIDGLRFLAQSEAALQNWKTAAAIYGFEADLRRKADVKLGEADELERAGDIRVIQEALGIEAFTLNTTLHQGESLDTFLAWLNSGDA